MKSKCPRCGKTYTEFPAISRRDNKTTEEALFDFQIHKEREWLKVR